MKPDWNKAPGWAKWFAVSPNGYCGWFDEKPKQGSSGWICTGKLASFYHSKIETVEDWFDTIEERI